MIEQWHGVLHHLNGLENNEKDGSGTLFNFVLSNGQRSVQRDEMTPTKYSFMMPAESNRRIRSVDIYLDGDCYYIVGFQFFDKERQLIFEIGFTFWPGLSKRTVMLEDNELIIGVVARLLAGSQSI